METLQWSFPWGLMVFNAVHVVVLMSVRLAGLRDVRKGGLVCSDEL